MISKYPAWDHAQKLVGELAKLLPKSEHGKTHGIFLQGSPTLFRDDTDRELPFHQEANFNYLTGVIHPNASVLITFTPSIDSDTDSKINHELFIPAADPEDLMWSVAPPTIEEARARYDSDSIKYTSDLSAALHHFSKRGKEGKKLTLHTLPYTTEYPAIPDLVTYHTGFNVVPDYLFTALHVARLTKDEHEIAWIREANRISSAAHELIMRELGRTARSRDVSQNKGKKNGDKEVGIRTGKELLGDWEIESEGDAEAVFVAACTRLGAKTQAYLPIVGSGSRASTLHYVCNDRLFPSTSVPRQPGDTTFVPPQLSKGCCGAFNPDHDHATPPTQLHGESFEPQVLLIDAGCEWQGYASDITRTIPVGNGGKFTKEAGEIYELVLRMQKEAEAITKPGVHWDTVHLHTHKVLVDGFIKLGIFSGDPEKILESGVTAGFYPHGLGHSLGLDVHDSRQYLRSSAGHLDIPPTSTITPKLYKYLRIRRPLVEGMVLTIEPGCYFPPALLELHGIWTCEYINQDILKKYLTVGGVRIEDVVVVREGGVENLTTVGREREWIEGVCSGST